MEVHAPRTNDNAVRNPRVISHSVPQDTRIKIIPEKMATNIAHTEYSALKKDSAPSKMAS
jgi:hypothetical protein